jgi:hypothetical protein
VPANLREFGAKEKFMEVCNPWILTHKPQMVLFVNSFCSIDEFEDASGMPRVRSCIVYCFDR